MELTEYKTLHQLSSGIGALIVLYAIFQLPVTDRVRRPFYFRYWIYIALIMTAILVTRFYTGLRIVDYREVIVTAISSLLIAIVVVSLFLRREYY
jgi:hypothetical protein